MDKSQSLTALAALAQETRLDVFRLLARSGPEGMCAGSVARSLGSRQNTISTNLAILARAGLIASRREGRNVWYYADAEGMRGLLAYLLEDCCGGAPGACEPLLKQVTRLDRSNPGSPIVAERVS